MPPKTFKRKGGGNAMGAAMKAAFQQRDSTQIVINSTESVTLAIPGETNGSTVVRNVTKLLCSTEFFQHYAAMYDQFKIDGVSVSAEIVYNTFGQAALTYPNVISAWDRNGIDKVTANVRVGGQNVDTLVVPGPYQVASYSSAVSRAFYPGSRWGITRRLVASSLQEKSIYLPTVKTAEVMTESSLYAAWNPDFLLSCLLGGKTPTCQSLVFNLSWSWVLTLRGLRKTSLDVIPTPLDGTLGYAPSNVGTIASGSNNAMIPAVLTTVDQATGRIDNVPIYQPNVQGLSGTQNSSASWSNDAFRFTVNNARYKINGINSVFYNFNNFTRVVFDTYDNLTEGDNAHIECKLYLICKKVGIGINLGYKVQMFLAFNAGQNTTVGGVEGVLGNRFRLGNGLIPGDYEVYASDQFTLLPSTLLSHDPQQPTAVNIELVQTVGSTTAVMPVSFSLASDAMRGAGNYSHQVNYSDFVSTTPQDNISFEAIPSTFCSSLYDNDGTCILPIRTA